MWPFFYLCLTLLYCAYLLAALSIVSALDDDENYWCSGDGLVLVLTSITALMMLYFLVGEGMGEGESGLCIYVAYVSIKSNIDCKQL